MTGATPRIFSLAIAVLGAGALLWGASSEAPAHDVSSVTPGPAAPCVGNPGAPVVDGWMRRYPLFRNPQLESAGHNLRVPWRAVPHNLSLVIEAPAGDRMLVHVWEWERAPVAFGPNTPELTIDLQRCFPSGPVPDLVVQHIGPGIQMGGTVDTMILQPKNADYKQARLLVVDVERTGDFLVALP
jgi:hypothetical protein